MSWLQQAQTVAGIVGGLAGVTAGVTVVAQRKKLRADAADVLTDTALTLVEPLKARVQELEREVGVLRLKVQRLMAAIFLPSATIEQLRELANEPDRGSTGNGNRPR